MHNNNNNNNNNVGLVDASIATDRNIARKETEIVLR
jgi:hypothetical protein